MWRSDVGNRIGSGMKTGKHRIRNDFEIIKLIFIMIKENKKWWLLPLLFVLGFLGLFASLIGGSSVLPVLYTLF